MKSILSFLLLSVTCFTLAAQPSNRYYPSVKGILNAPEDKMMSRDFDFFDNWIRKNAQTVFCKDLQTSGSPNGDASFYSLSLVFRRDTVFQFGNSGIELKVRTDASGAAMPAITIQQQYKILAYLRSFNPSGYDPKDLKKKFQLGLLIYNISEEQAMAQFLNHYVVADKKHASTPLQQLKYDIKQKKKIELQFDESKDQQILKKVATQIYEQSNAYSSAMLYDLYIQSATAAATAKNFNQFFRSVSPTAASETIDDVVAYNMTVHFSKKDIGVQLPEKYISLFNKEKDILVPEKTALMLYPASISIKTVYAVPQKYLEIKLALNSDKSDNRMFKVFNVLPEDKANPRLSDAAFTYAVSKISSIEMRVYDNHIEADMVMDEGSPIVSKLPFIRQAFSLD